jgi:hypothetical protein
MKRTKGALKDVMPLYGKAKSSKPPAAAANWGADTERIPGRLRRRAHALSAHAGGRVWPEH